METENWLDIHLSTVNFSSETKFEIPSCNHVISETGRTVYFTEGRTDHTGTETDRRHEANPDRGDSNDVGGENHGRASGPGVREFWRWLQRSRVCSSGRSKTGRR